MAKTYVVEQRPTFGAAVMRDSRTGRIMSRDTFDRATRAANNVIERMPRAETQKSAK